MLNILEQILVEPQFSATPTRISFPKPGSPRALTAGAGRDRLWVPGARGRGGAGGGAAGRSLSRAAPGASARSQRQNGGRRLRRASHLHSPAVIFIRGGNEVVIGALSVAEPDIQIEPPVRPVPRPSAGPGRARGAPFPPGGQECPLSAGAPPPRTSHPAPRSPPVAIALFPVSHTPCLCLSPSPRTPSFVSLGKTASDPSDPPRADCP